MCCIFGDCTNYPVIFGDYIGIVHILPSFNWLVVSKFFGIFSLEDWVNDPI